MLGVIAGKTREIIYDCCKKHSKTSSVSLDDIQLILGLNVVTENGSLTIADENNICTYMICEQYRKVKTLSIWEVLDVKPFLDFLGYSKLAPPFIFKALNRFAEKYNIDYDKVAIMCQPTLNEKNKPDVLLALYDGNKYVEQIKFYAKDDEENAEYLFDETDIEME